MEISRNDLEAQGRNPALFHVFILFLRGMKHKAGFPRLNSVSGYRNKKDVTG